MGDIGSQPSGLRRVLEATFGSIVGTLLLSLLLIAVPLALGILQHLPWALTLAATVVVVAAGWSLLDRVRLRLSSPSAAAPVDVGDLQTELNSLKAEVVTARADLQHWHVDGIDGSVLEVVIQHTRRRDVRLHWHEFEQLARWVIWLEQNRAIKPKPDLEIRENRRDAETISLSLIVRGENRAQVTGLGEITRDKSAVNDLRDIEQVVQDAWQEIHEREKFKELRPY